MISQELTAVSCGRDSGSLPTGDLSEVWPIAGRDELRGAQSTTTATPKGDKRILFNLFATSTHHVKLLAFRVLACQFWIIKLNLKFKVLLLGDSCLLREPSLKLAGRRFPHFLGRGGSGLCPLPG